MTSPDVAAIEARLAAATPGPWYAWDRGVGFHIAVEDPALLDRPPRLIPEGFRTDIDRGEDAEFIAHAPADIAALLAEVKRLRATVDEAEELAGRLYNQGSEEAGKVWEILGGGPRWLAYLDGEGTDG